MKGIDFFFAARPMLHLPAWSFYLITCHMMPGSDGNILTIPIGFISISLLLSAVYYHNQIYDFETDRINRKLGFLQTGYISIREMQTAAVGCAAAALISAAAIGLKGIVIVGAGLLLGYAYSAPPPRMKDRPIGGGVSNAVGYGFLIPMLGPGYFDHPGKAALLSLYFFLAVLALYLLTTLADRDGDILTGKRTVATIWDKRVVLLITGIMLLGTIETAIFLQPRHLLLVSVISTAIFLPALIWGSMGKIMIAIKVPILLLSLLAGYYYPVYLLFIIALIILTRIYYRKRFNIIYPKLT